MRCRTIERRRNSGKQNEERRKERSRILAVLQSLYKYHWESPRALLPPVSPILIPGNINFIIFSPYPLYAFYHPSRARTKRRDLFLSYVTTRNEVQRAYAASTYHESYACSRCSVFFVREALVERTFYQFVYYNQNYVVNEAIMFT